MKVKLWHESSSEALKAATAFTASKGSNAFTALRARFHGVRPTSGRRAL